MKKIKHYINYLIPLTVLIFGICVFYYGFYWINEGYIIIGILFSLAGIVCIEDVRRNNLKNNFASKLINLENWYKRSKNDYE